MKKTSAEMIKKIENSIITYLSENPQRTRKETIDGALEIYGEKKKNNDPDSTYNLVRSLIGTKINEMLNEKDIISKDKKLSLKKDGLVIVKESKCRQQVLVCLKQSPASFDNLNSSLQKFFDTDKTASKKTMKCCAYFCSPLLTK